MNPIRFFENAESSSLTILLLGRLVGSWDPSARVLIFWNQGHDESFWHSEEKDVSKNGQNRLDRPFFDCIACIIPWIVNVMYFLAAINSSGAEPPGFVYFIIPTLFTFFNRFAVNIVMLYKRIGRWTDYLFGKRVYIILSLKAKTVLAWSIFVGTLVPIQELRLVEMQSLQRA